MVKTIKKLLFLTLALSLGYAQAGIGSWIENIGITLTGLYMKSRYGTNNDYFCHPNAEPNAYYAQFTPLEESNQDIVRAIQNRTFMVNERKYHSPQWPTLTKDNTDEITEIQDTTGKQIAALKTEENKVAQQIMRERQVPCTFPERPLDKKPNPYKPTNYLDHRAGTLGDFNSDRWASYKKNRTYYPQLDTFAQERKRLKAERQQTIAEINKTYSDKVEKSYNKIKKFFGEEGPFITYYGRSMTSLDFGTNAYDPARLLSPREVAAYLKAKKDKIL